MLCIQRCLCGRYHVSIYSHIYICRIGKSGVHIYKINDEKQTTLLNCIITLPIYFHFQTDDNRDKLLLSNPLANGYLSSGEVFIEKKSIIIYRRNFDIYSSK